MAAVTAAEEMRALLSELRREAIGRTLYYLNVSLVAYNAGVAVQSRDMVEEGLWAFVRDCEKLARLTEGL